MTEKQIKAYVDARMSLPLWCRIRTETTGDAVRVIAWEDSHPENEAWADDPHMHLFDGYFWMRWNLTMRRQNRLALVAAAGFRSMARQFGRIRLTGITS